MTTATPPKILDTDLKLNMGKESDFQSMLEDFGSPKEASFDDELADPVWEKESLYSITIILCAIANLLLRNHSLSRQRLKQLEKHRGRLRSTQTDQRKSNLPRTRGTVVTRKKAY